MLTFTLLSGIGRVASQVQRLRGPARVLLVIEHSVLGDIVKLALNHGQYNPRSAESVEEAATLLSQWHPHLLILDMELSGNQVLDQLVDAPRPGRRVPVIALTRRGDLRAKLDAFDRGVDDILTVPFSPEEFVARAMAVMRRSYQDTVVFTPVLRVGDLEIDVLSRRVRLGQTDLHLTALEQSLLYLLAANAGRLLTRDEILDHLWGADYVAGSNIVDRHIRNLRLKLRDPSRRPRHIVTVPKRGYRFVSSTPDETK